MMSLEEDVIKELAFVS